MKFKLKEKPYKGRRSIKIEIQTKDWKAPTIEEALLLVQLYCVAEEYRYPQEEGFDGKRRFLNAINDIGKGETLESVLKKHGVHNTKRRVELLFDDERSLEVYRQLSKETLISQTTLSFADKGVSKMRCTDCGIELLGYDKPLCLLCELDRKIQIGMDWTFRNPPRVIRKSMEAESNG